MSIPSMQQTPAPTGKPPIGDRLKALLAEWGPLLLVVWFGLFATVLVGFVVAIEFGFKVESTAGALGTWGAAYVATQLTKPLRFAATVVITPALGTFLKRFRRKEAPIVGAEPPAAELSTREPPARELR